MRFKRETDLQTMCLYVIVDNINLFSRHKDSTEVYIDFLRRRYSDRLFELIERKCLIPEEYLVWLISPYWTNVSLQGSGYAFPAVVFKFKSMGDTITSLNLDHNSCSSGTLSAIICCVKNVTSLNLSGTHVTDEILLLIRRMCTSLISLNLSNCRNLTDTGWENLCNMKYKPIGFPSLKALNINRTGITMKNTTLILKHLTTLQIVSYHNLPVVLYKLHQSAVADTDGGDIKYNLTNFDYQPVLVNVANILKPVLDVCTIICPYISNIFIQDKISENHLQSLVKFKSLEKLKLVNIVHYSKEACSITPLITLKSAMITQLELSQLKISADVIVDCCVNLKYLFLCGVVFEDFNAANKISNLNNLESFKLKHVVLNDECSFKSVELLLSSSRNLNELCIQYAEHFTNDIADVILNVPNLTVVDFSFTDIKPSTLLKFFDIPNLKKIYTDGCPNISLSDRASDISKLINESSYGNTCSWQIDYSELEKEPSWNCSSWSMDNPFENKVL